MNLHFGQKTFWTKHFGKKIGQKNFSPKNFWIKLFQLFWIDFHPKIKG
jgi:hypothetical protein